MEATIFEKRRNSTSTNISMHKHSYTITKTKPKIRIIHIFAPEIIKTDVANFRELVQSLTGKPQEDKHINVSKTKPKVQRELQDCDKGFCLNSHIDEISMAWNGVVVGDQSSSGGFLNGLGDFEGFIQELGEFPYLPFTSSIDVSASSDNNSSSSTSHLHCGSILSDSYHHFE
ncbi:unnamed protein product [Cochlearia groenlandica]